MCACTRTSWKFCKKISKNTSTFKWRMPVVLVTDLQQMREKYCFPSPILDFLQFTKATSTVRSTWCPMMQLSSIRRVLYLGSIDCPWQKHITVYSYKTLYNHARQCSAPLHYCRRWHHCFTYQSTTYTGHTIQQYKQRKKVKKGEIVAHSFKKYLKQRHSFPNLTWKPQHPEKMVLSLQRWNHLSNLLS